MSSNYNGAFGSNDDDAQIFNFDVSGAAARYGRGDHTMRGSTDPDSLRDDAEQLRGIDDAAADLLDQAADLYDRGRGASISAFECPECGLRHSHGRKKHVLTDNGVSGLKVRPAFANVMVFNKRCHCGVNELSMLLRFVEHIEVQIFRDISNDQIPRPAAVNAAERLNNNVFREVLIDELGEDLVAEAMEYRGSDALNRVISVRNAADSAPISSDTRQGIEEIEAELTNEIEADPLAEAFERHNPYGQDGRRAHYSDERISKLAREVWVDVFEQGEDFRLSEVREYVRDQFGQ